MNKIVREHYPAAKLPEDLRREIGAGKRVTITIEVEDDANEKKRSGDDWFSRYEHLRRGTFHSLDEVNEHVSALRDEWDHRDR